MSADGPNCPSSRTSSDPGTIRDLLEAGTRALREISASPRLDAELLLSWALERPRSHILAWPEKRPTGTVYARYCSLLERRASHEPVAYIMGRREFWSLEFEVGSTTLIPRPETELLVECALARIPGDAAWTIADLGTGCGAIAVALASERTGIRVVATDISDAALSVARRNAERLAPERIELRRGDWCSAFQESEFFDLVVCNPPYIGADDIHLRSGELSFEPIGALQGGRHGIEQIARLIAACPGHLRPGAWLMLEHGYDQGAATRGMMRAMGFCPVEQAQDGAGLDRVVCGCWNG